MLSNPLTSAPASTSVAAPTLLLVDDDTVFRNRLAQAMQKKGFIVSTAATAAEAKIQARQVQPAYAVLDLRLADNENGLTIVPTLREENPNCRIIMLTGYGNIASAVLAIKAGAIDYLAKPIDADAIHAALLANSAGAVASLPPLPENPMPANRVKWEHIARVFEQSGRNVSATARKLHMHRRTLQRILGKYAPAENTETQP